MPQDLCVQTVAVSIRELYLLRRADLRARRKLLEAQLAQQAFQELVLQVERRYGLLGARAQLDIHTGRIVWEGQNESGRDAHPAAPGPA